MELKLFRNKTVKDSNSRPEQRNNWLTLDAIEYRSKRTRNIADIVFFFKRLFEVGAFLIVFFGLIFGLHPVRNADMEPRISAGDLVVYFRWVRDYYKGDVVVYSQDGSSKLGRVMARPGDTVEITNDERLMVNGYIEREEKIVYSTPAYDDKITYPLLVGDNEYFILADYREGAKDSRYFGSVSSKQIKGRAVSVMRWTDL